MDADGGFDDVGEAVFYAGPSFALGLAHAHGLACQHSALCRSTRQIQCPACSWTFAGFYDFSGLAEL